MLNEINVVGFDADDTLWDNEPFYRQAEHEFCLLLKEYMSEDELNRALLSTEIGNLGLYGYGIKAFTLSLIETAIKISNGNINATTIGKIVALGKNMLTSPVTILSNVEDVLQQLYPHYKLIIATKGDLLDQERKLKKSGLARYFHHIEVMSDKQPNNYQTLLRHLEISPNNFLMVGNSLKSDIIPVLELGGYSAFVPYHTTWQHEYVDERNIQSSRYFKLQGIAELPSFLGL